MYKIIKNNEAVDVQVKPCYIRQNERNKILVGCGELAAEGIVLTDGSICQLEGKTPLEGEYDTVTLEAIDRAEFRELAEQLGIDYTKILDDAFDYIAASDRLLNTILGVSE